VVGRRIALRGAVESVESNTQHANIVYSRMDYGVIGAERNVKSILSKSTPMLFSYISYALCSTPLSRTSCMASLKPRTRKTLRTRDILVRKFANIPCLLRQDP